MCNTLMRKLVLIRVFVTQLFPKNELAMSLKYIVDDSGLKPYSFGSLEVDDTVKRA